MTTSDLNERDWTLKFTGYVANRIGGYRIVEGTGGNGGQWAAISLRDRMVFTSRKTAEEHAELSSPERD